MRNVNTRQRRDGSRRGRDHVLFAGLGGGGRELQARLQESEQRFRAIFSSVGDGVIVHDVHSAAFLDVNARLCELLGYGRDELLGKGLADLSPSDAVSAAGELAGPLRTVAEEGAAAFEWLCKAKDGGHLWLEIAIRRASFGAQEVLVSTVRDVSERKRADARIAHSARYDQLTDLPNRGVFVETLVGCIDKARAGGRNLAVLYLDLDDFKAVNGTLGHPVGDRLLQSVAERLRRNLRASDTVARFGGDEFAVILDTDEPSLRAPPAEERRTAAAGGGSGAAGATRAAVCVAKKLLQTLGQPFIVDGVPVRSSASIGIALWDDDQPNAEMLLSRADVALNQAKAERQGTWRVFTPAMGTRVQARVTMALEMTDAIAADQFILMYQPQIEIESGRIAGLEALARWRHPTRGLLSAGDFIPEAETNGLIAPLGRWVIREACRQTRLWMDSGVTPPLVAVNISALQFDIERALADDIAGSLAEFALSPQHLELELTESVLMETSRAHNDVIRKLRAKGHRIAIDDFGTGYSSLDYLRRYPVDRIKLDPNFIGDIGKAPGADAIVRVAYELGRALGAEVVAEGVETEAQLRLLESFGAKVVQGYYFAKPLAAAEVTRLLHAEKTTG